MSDADPSKVVFDLAELPLPFEAGDNQILCSKCGRRWRAPAEGVVLIDNWNYLIAHADTHRLEIRKHPRQPGLE